jgi:hypothetical protein
MDYRRMSADEGPDGGLVVPHEIPDIAAEAAQGATATLTQRGAARLDGAKVAALVKEIEACQRILALARE